MRWPSWATDEQITSPEMWLPGFMVDLQINSIIALAPAPRWGQIAATGYGPMEPYYIHAFVLTPQGRSGKVAAARGAGVGSKKNSRWEGKPNDPPCDGPLAFWNMLTADFWVVAGTG